NERVRLSAIVAEMVLRDRLAMTGEIISEDSCHLSNEFEWQRRLASLASRGITAEDLADWASIMSANDGDTKLQRFIASDRPKPTFLLLALVGKDNAIHDTTNILALLDYVDKTYIKNKPTQRFGKSTFLLGHHNFLIFVSRLAWQCLRRWPSGLVSVSHLVVSYIESLAYPSQPEKLAPARCLVFNEAIRILSWPAIGGPMKHMQFNWEAQKVLLSLSLNTQPPLILNRASYRSMRKVLVALPKTLEDMRAAQRGGKTWPPFRQAWDGTDEQRQPEEDISRSILAGILMKEAGYAPESVDNVLTTLGGGAPGEPPTIQTRSLVPRWETNYRAVYLEWAAHLKTARNAREAWQIFQQPPQPKLKPNAQVYAAMFEKLFARPADVSPAIVPGNVKETFPVHNVNLTPFEIARLEPPSSLELYDMMLNQGIKPDDDCLALLLRNARSREMGMQFFRASHYEPLARALLEPTTDEESCELLRKIPLKIFNAWIFKLCETNPNPVSKKSHRHDHRLDYSYCHISEAIQLTIKYQNLDGFLGRFEKAPWYTILGHLASTKNIFSAAGESRNNLETLETFMRIFRRLRAQEGDNDTLFKLLCRMTQKTMRMSLFCNQRHHDIFSREFKTELSQAHKTMIDCFTDLTKPIQQRDGAWTLRYTITGGNVYCYMQALGAFGNGEEMVKLMDWIIDSWDQPHMLEQAKSQHTLDWQYMIKTFSYFLGMSSMVEAKELERLQNKLAERQHSRLEGLSQQGSCSWFFPASSHGQEGVEMDITMATIWKKLGRGLECLPSSTLVTPKSRYQGFEPQHPLVPERVALADLLRCFKNQDRLAGRAYIELELDNFSFYINSACYPFEMRPLHHLATKAAHDTYYFDGILSFGNVRHYVSKVEVSELPIGNYGGEHDTVQDQIWVRSRSNSKQEIYYRLKKPSAEYTRFHEPFLWIADLAKHVVDFCSSMIEDGLQVSLDSFKESFIRWLLRTHSKSPSFQKWRLQHPSDNFSRQMIGSIKPGDTISTPRDGDSTDTKWAKMQSKGSIDDNRWFGLVQKVHINEKTDLRSFDVTWFYRPSETPCCMMKYPWHNELFLSDHCTCEEGRVSRVHEHEVLATHAVDWFGRSDSSKGEFFVRQTYMVENRRWVSLQESHLTCSHSYDKFGYNTGDTILAALSPSDDFAEAYEVVKIFRQGANRSLRLRRLLRRSLADPGATNAAPNELVYTDQLLVVNTDKITITGKCAIRFFRSEEPIPSPFNRGGTGNLFFITHRLDTAAKLPTCVPFSSDGFPPCFRQGFDPSRTDFQKLRGLDLYCGSGNFGRGLEDGGAVDMCWANDISPYAIHTYMANARAATRPFLGSVDGLLGQALQGKFADNVPRPGEVDFISGGTPCPGFSLLTVDKTTLSQLKNQSLVASFAAFVDFYRPKYGVLENVTSIVQADHNRTEDMLSQLFCAIVGLGYQAQLIMGDAWSYGAPQSRSRVFLYFAAPGLRLPEAPRPSHSHFPTVKSRGLGKLCNQEPFVRRSFSPTPFKYVSAGEGTADLPFIGDAKADSCVGFPDHRLAVGITSRIRQQITAIPIHPHGMNFAKAWNLGKGTMTRGERELFPPEGSHRTKPISHGWGRICPGDTFPTVTTRSQPTDARCGRIHWHEDRPLTIMEVRRAQGFLDHEVLIGNTTEQWRQVGNSVARQMAVAIGLQFREAWLGSLYDGAGSRNVDKAPAGLTGHSPETKLGHGACYGAECTSSSGSPSPSESGTGARCETTPATTMSDSTEACATPKVVGGRRKRLLSQAAKTPYQSKLARIGASFYDRIYF
ncbi:hypothetical protein B0T26DRAFT_648766, partial [Lasiosphaeria miniovina]